MYQCAEIYLPRKKKVRDNFHSNTFRIFDERIPDRLDPDNVYKAHTYSTRDPKEYDLHKIHNSPQPCHAKFIRTNVRFLNAPVSHMETEQTKDEQQSRWWSNWIEPGLEVKAAYSSDSTQRTDYQATPPAPAPLGRHTPHHHRTAASGIIPTLSPLGRPKVLLEHMSFIHQYDSRKTQDQPYQGRRHGALVWREMSRLSLGGPRAFLSAAEEEKEGGEAVTSPQPPPPPPAYSNS